MKHRIIMTLAVSNWQDGDAHASVVVGGQLADGTPVEETIGLELPEMVYKDDVRRYVRQALCAVLAEL